MPLNLMFKDFELKTDKLDSEFTLRIPEVTKSGIDKLDASRKKVLNKYFCPSLTSFYTSRITTGTVAAI